MSGSVVQAALDLAAGGNAARGAALLAEAGDRGNRDALWQLAIWHIAGSPIPRDLVIGRSLLRRAAELGHIDAAHMEIALAANGSGGSADWQGARRQLDALTHRDAYAAEVAALLNEMSLDSNGFPRDLPRTERLSDAPNIWRVPRLFTPSECQHVANVAVDMLSPAMVVDPTNGRSIPHPIRTSHDAVIGPTRETLAIQALNRRIAAISNTDWRQGEALTVLRYQPGQQFRSHHDAIGGARNQRFRTVLIYLNEAFEGGETSFGAIGLSIRPRVGDAIIFDNTTSDGGADLASRHAGEPVRRGVKWLATRWIRERPFNTWTGPESA